jgi:hypothetical protein
MTQRSIQLPTDATAHRAARSAVAAAAPHASRTDIAIVNVVLSALILVVVVLLITTPHGAG